MKIQAAVVSLINIITIPSLVGGSASIMQCDTSPCLESVAESCESIRYYNDFKGDNCCYALIDTADGGCGITIKTTGGSCSRNGRGFFVSIGDSVGDGMSDLAGPLLQYEVTTPSAEGTGCPASEYPVKSASQDGFTPSATMTLTGVNSWSEQETAAWIELTNSFVQDYLATNTPYADIISEIQVYTDGGAVLNGDTRSATLTYLHGLGWRTDSTENVTFYEILETAFNTDAGSGAYLKALQASGNSVLASVTDSSGFGEVPPPAEEEDGTPPGGVGGGAAQVHDSQTNPTEAPSAASVEPEALQAPAPEPNSASTSRKLGLTLIVVSWVSVLNGSW